MNRNPFGRDQRDYIRFGRNRFGEENVHHDSYQDDQFKNDYDPTYEDEYGMKHPYEHSGKKNRWSDDIRSEASHEKNHVGKGPKGYKRGGQRIIEDANEILTEDWDLDASDIVVDYQDGCLTLKGEVQSRYDKRLAEALVENISGVEDVINQLKVNRKIEGWIPGIGHVKESDSPSGG